MLDTNVLLDKNINLDDFEDLYICTSVLEELDGLKKSEGELGYNARKIIRLLEKSDNINYIVQDLYNVPESWDKNKRDNQIVMAAKENNCFLYSNDFNVRIKAKSIGVECEGYVRNNVTDINYKGWKEIVLNDYQMATFYGEMKNDWNLINNEYLIIKNSNGEYVDVLKYKDETFNQITKKKLDSMMFGNKLKPKDVYQEIAIDSLVSDNFTIITGRAGSGKSLLSLMYCLWAIQHGKYDKVIILNNPTKTRGSTELGWYSGNRLDKMLQNSIGTMLNSKLGDPIAIHTLISQNKLDIIPISDVRGMEITDNQILYISEAQNQSIDLCKLSIQRASKNAKILLEGDIDTQVDAREFEGHLNGLRRAIEVFKGEDMFSTVYLPNIHRSRIADIADKM